MNATQYYIYFLYTFALRNASSFDLEKFWTRNSQKKKKIFFRPTRNLVKLMYK